MSNIVKATAAAPVATSSITVDWFQRFIDYVDASPKTLETYRKSIRRFMTWISEHRVTQPQRADILAYKQDLEAQYKNTTVQAYLEAVKLFFQWTAIEGLYPDIAKHIKGEKVDREHKKEYLTPDGVRRVLQGIDREKGAGLRDYAILVLMFTGGLRTVEVSRANVEDLGAVGGVPVLFVQGKGYTDRREFVKLTPHTEAAIREYLKSRGPVKGSEPLFISTSHNNAGGRLTTRSVSAIAKGAMVRAGYNSDKYTAHSTRHTAVTLALLAGKPLEEVQQFARHANPATTLIYAHHLDKVKNSCAAAVEAAIF